MAGKRIHYYKRPEYEYLSRWPCGCHPAEPCSQCDGKGYLEDWLPLEDTLNFIPVTIMSYRIAGMPGSTQLYPAPSVRDDEIVRDAEMDPA